MNLNLHDEASAFVEAPAEHVFTLVDDHTRLSSHMSRSSWKMGGGRMDLVMDRDRGRRVGSRIQLSGRVFGFELSVDEVVTEREPPHRKVWETVGIPRLLVIGPYRMGFEVTPTDHGSLLRVFIDYARPEGTVSRWLGRLFGGWYARWCTRRMVIDTVRYFAQGGSRSGEAGAGS